MLPFSFDHVIRAAELVRERVLRATAALEAAGVAYAVGGDHASAVWVARAGLGGVRNPVDIDVFVARGDLPAVAAALTTAGFVRRQVNGSECFMDGPSGRPRDAVRLFYAGEHGMPAVAESEPGPDFWVLTLDAFVRVELLADGYLNRTRLRDLIDVELVDETWLARVPPDLAPRLQHLLDTPGG